MEGNRRKEAGIQRRRVRRRQGIRRLVTTVKAGNLFTLEEEERVGATIRRVETRTSGEIVTLVVDRSDTYPHLPFLGGMLGLLVASLPAIWQPSICHPLALLLFQTLGFAGGFLVLRSSATLRRALLPPALMEERVFQRALSTFRELEMNLSPERNGVLIFVSLLERRVQVLADSGINARVRPGTWNAVVEIVLKGIRAGDLSSGLSSAIERCGEILAQEFPAEKTDRNEPA